MKLTLSRICIIPICLLAIAEVALGQERTSGTVAPSATGVTGQTPFLPSVASDGLESGGYRIHQSVELGYRVSDTTGSNAMYDTLVNLHGGPRMLEQGLSMQSIEHQGVLFDNFFVHSFGWGGDADNGLRVRIDKNHWFDFRGNFRRDQNYFDYNLLANPLNPSTSKSERSGGILTAQLRNHASYDRRGLTILPSVSCELSAGLLAQQHDGRLV
jgi:hypothetical protein